MMIPIVSKDEVWDVVDDWVGSQEGLYTVEELKDLEPMLSAPADTILLTITEKWNLTPEQVLLLGQLVDEVWNLGYRLGTLDENKRWVGMRVDL